MLHVENESVRRHLLDGNFGLEKESLRVTGDGKFAQTLHPFPDDDHIVKDFCENQTEINTSVHKSAQDAVEELVLHTNRIVERLQSLPEKEYLWLFSNPSYIEKERDIPIALFEGMKASKAIYRQYLSDKYGRYKMTFCGIHVNYSFSDELLQANFEASAHKGESFRDYKDRTYLTLAKKMAAYGWILVAVTAASPLLDSSFFEKGVYDGDVFTGMASVRCSELGYWNAFAPVFDYSNIETYTGSIRKYVSYGLLRAPSELYYPIRLKPHGENTLDRLEQLGVDHIELRMFDLNPLREEGVDVRDIVFAQLLMVWLASTPDEVFQPRDHVQVVQNFKNAARYDLKTVKIPGFSGQLDSVAQTGTRVIEEMKEFYADLPFAVDDVLQFEYNKFVSKENRYSWQVRQQFSGGFAKKALALAKARQEKTT